MRSSAPWPLEDSKKGAISCLPARVDRMVLHGGATLFKVVGLHVANDQAVRLQKERVIAPAAFAEGFEHLRPDLRMAGFVLVHLFRADFE